jgi:branched-chain amino acid transport system permease protein
MQFSFSGPVLAQALASGIMLGGMFALISIGLTLIWGVMKIINFAHGEFLMLGLYVAYFMVADVHISPYLTFFVTIPAVALIGVVIFKATIDPILKDPVMNQIMLTLGLSLILQNLALVAFHADVLSVTTRWTTMNIHLGSVVIGVSQLICLVGSILATLGLWYFLKTTDVGRSIRAAAQNPTAATLMGINVPRIYMFAFALGSATLGFAASLMIPFYYTSPTVGAFLGLIAFIVVVLGGMGNLLGCFIGGIIMGLGESIGAAIFPGSLSRVFSFGIFVLFLVFLPQGVLSRRRRA